MCPAHERIIVLVVPVWLAVKLPMFPQLTEVDRSSPVRYDCIKSTTGRRYICDDLADQQVSHLRTMAKLFLVFPPLTSSFLKVWARFLPDRSVAFHK